MAVHSDGLAAQSLHVHTQEGEGWIEAHRVPPIQALSRQGKGYVVVHSHS